jgi:signal transduction histidine kinase
LSDLDAESGRGLALVRAFAVEMLIGNRPQHGAYVSVILPVRRADVDRRAETAPPGDENS